MPKKINKQIKKKKQLNPFKTKQKKYSKQDMLALIFALAAVGFLLIYSIAFLVEKQSLIDSLTKSLTDSPEILPLLPSLITVLCLVWLVFAIIMSFIIYKIEQKKYKWYSLLIISIISLFALNPCSFVLGLIASILYIRHHK